MNELTYDEYLHLYRALSRRQLSLKSTHNYRGFDKKGYLLSIDGRNDQILIPPEVILDLSDFNQKQKEKIKVLLQKLKMIVLEAIRTNTFSPFQKKKFEEIFSEYESASEIYVKVQNYIQMEKSGVTSTVIDLQKSLMDLQESLSTIGTSKASLHNENNQNDEYDVAATSYVQKNRQLLDVSRALDQILLHSDRSDNFFVRQSAISLKQSLTPDLIKVKIF